MPRGWDCPPGGRRIEAERGAVAELTVGEHPEQPGVDLGTAIFALAAHAVASTVFGGLVAELAQRVRER